MGNLLILKTINELKEESFCIPSYQRGYRWTQRQVEDLLNDILEFKSKPSEDTDSTTWYCLQPIVVKKKDNGHYEVIDGQQRLTTIYLILKVLSEMLDEPKKLFNLTYETREGSASFLKDLQKDKRNENVDFFYIYESYQTILGWFKKQLEFNPNFNIKSFDSKFVFKPKVIWYETSEDDPISVFTRINMGKIPLTNAELIKALFLNSSNFDKNKSEKIRLKQLEISTEWDNLNSSNFDKNKSEKIRLKQLEISTEWDNIEHSLQDDSFWYFLNDKDVTTNRIEFIFDLMNDEDDSADNYSTFRFFNKKFNNNNPKTIKDNWSEIKGYFQRFEEWFEEKELYHKIGYLIAATTRKDTIKDTIKKLSEESEKLTKPQFRALLDTEIQKGLKKVDLEALEYGDSKNNKKIKSVLLLYNILTMLNNKNDTSRFPFDSFKSDKFKRDKTSKPIKWDIEHITSIAEQIPSNKELWLNDAKGLIDKSIEGGCKLAEEAENFDCDEDEKFKKLYTDIVEHFNIHLEDENLNDISNLALLDSGTNRSYKNAVFPLKRKKIIEKEKSGTFIPIGTKNVFLKYFSTYPPKISFWTQDDRVNYYEDLELILSKYINTRNSK